jgi:aryl-alcohol dehydrogenase-like predicted oxidoreductase
MSAPIHRMGYGAMQLTGPMAWGPPRDMGAAVAVLREAMDLGINHVDTSDYYGPHIANQIIRKALHPYLKDLVIATKVGARRGADKSWPAALSAGELTSAVHDNLRHLGLDALDIVNLRLGSFISPNEDSVEAPLATLLELKSKGLIRHIGLSNVSPRQIAQAQSMTDIVCVQNHYNLANRSDDVLIGELAQQQIAFVPFFPLGGFKPLKSPALDAAAAALDASTRQVALAWLLQRSPNILVIAGTSSVAHLRDNMKAANLQLPPDIMANLDAIAVSGDRNGAVR